MAAASSDPAAVESSPPEPKFWCTKTNPALAEEPCFRRRDRCNAAARQVMKKDGSVVVRCVGRWTAACYEMAYGSESVSLECFESLSVCVPALEAFEKTTHAGVISRRCALVR